MWTAFLPFIVLFAANVLMHPALASSKKLTKSQCDSALADANSVSSRVEKLESDAAELGEYKAYSFYSTTQNVDRLLEHETKKQKILKEMSALQVKGKKAIGVLQRCIKEGVR
ncbi:MAG: hypothetical protein FJ077_09470 [Cyanobacteria bacterium K_DeepCast_35m_m2_023]|nr:hypothetical protein [Cyanobacteria bacterium K_DeepCast_35m_m2_023]